MDARASTATANLVRTGPRGGVPVVLIHPAGLDLTYWDRQIATLSQTHDVVAFDLPGLGLSRGQADEWTLGGVVDFVSEVIYSTTEGAVHLVGISLGGMLAQAVALERPDQVYSLSLLNTTPGLPADAQTAIRARAQTIRDSGIRAAAESTVEGWFTEHTLRGRPDIRDRAVKTLLGGEPTVHAAMWDLVAGFDLRERLSEIRQQTLVVAAEQDTVTPLDASVALRDGIPGARLRVVPNAAHLSQMEQPDALNADLLDFFADIH